MRPGSRLVSGSRLPSRRVGRVRPALVWHLGRPWLRRLRRDEAGQFAGIEVLPFGLLVFVIGVLVVANAWAVVDAKLAVVSAAREATRAYVESPPESDPLARAEAAARSALVGAGRDPSRLTLTPIEADFSRCGRVRFEASYPIPLVRVPFLGGYGAGFTARARHGEIVDPYRSGVPSRGVRC